MPGKIPVSDGDIAGPTERVIVATPDAADRTSGITTADASPTKIR